MLELNASKKNKINLSDYNSQQDISNRSLLANLSFFEHEVLQEIFFSPLKISSKKLARSLGCEEEALSPILAELARAGLLVVQDDTIIVDKESRKYFEFHMKRFDADFKPDMEYLQGIFRKVPIHLLPSWYAIPRTSNNIFESIVEKYLTTPQLFLRYISELHVVHPLAYKIMQDVFSSPEYRISSQNVMEKYNLTRSEFEETLLFLEFSFACCVVYTRGEGCWLEWITPFHEWSEYLRFFQATDTASIPDQAQVNLYRKNDFAFVEDLAFLLQKIKTSPLPTSVKESVLTSFSSPVEPQYYTSLQNKLILLQLATEEKGMLVATEQATEFLNLQTTQKAVYIYRHPSNRIVHKTLPIELLCEKNIREVEKSIKRILRKGWVFFDEFIKGVVVSLRDDTQVVLKRVGKSWGYTLPTYSEEEKDFIKVVLFQWLFEAGMVSLGKSQGRDCIAVTSFGRSFFEE